jgi:hypothetical protein
MRYLRIAPSSLIVSYITFLTTYNNDNLLFNFKMISFAVMISMIINDKSQFFMIENIEENCKNNWWKNILLIQNFQPLNEICMSWTWFIAADFQLFILSIFLLEVSVR